MFLSKILALALVVPLPAFAGSVQLYQCTGADQKITFQDFPCKGAAAAKIVNVDPSPPLSGTKSLQQTQRDLDALNRRVSGRVAADNATARSQAGARQLVLEQCNEIGQRLHHTRVLLRTAVHPDRLTLVSQANADTQAMQDLRCPAFGQY
jgi:hypothetical protein